MLKQVTEEEMQKKEVWIRANLLAASPPFSFTYAGESSEQLLANWPREVAVHEIDKSRRQYVLTWDGASAGLQVRCLVVEYCDSPVIEWTIYLKNIGTTPSPIIAKVQGLDTTVAHQGEGEFVLHHNQGDTCSPEAYKPFHQLVAKDADLYFAPVGGRPTSLAFPYFNLEDGAGGTIIAFGWPGQWSAHFAMSDQGMLRIQGGQELTHFSLLPGEEVRTPLVVLMFWQGDYLRSQNLWRQWMFAHNLPRRQGELPPPVSAMCAGLHQNEVGEEAYIDLLTRNQAGLDYWWMDAGWFPGVPGPLGEWSQAGTWQPDPQRFPGGIKAVADYAHARKMKLVLWFELERVSPGSTWSTQPEWLLALKPEDRHFRLREDLGTLQFTLDEAHRNQIREGDQLFNLGDPEAQCFLTDYVSTCIRQWGIDLFRLDFNISPLLFWRAADAPDRQGITENKYVCGLLAFFDELLKRHPTLLIDSCASGGRRIDLETVRRSVVYTRSDYWGVSTTADQCQTQGIASWVSHYMTTTSYDDTYRFYSNLAPSLGISIDFNHPERVDWTLFRQRMALWRNVAPLFYGDYYPLSEWSNQENTWLAWQFDRPEQGDGIFQAFRRKDSGETSQVYRLHGLDDAAWYELTNLDTGLPMASQPGMTGSDLMEHGLEVQIMSQPGVAAFIYRKRAPDAG